MNDDETAEVLGLLGAGLQEAISTTGILLLAVDALIRSHPDPQAFARHFDGSLNSTQVDALGKPRGSLPSAARDLAERLLAVARQRF